MCFYGVRGFSRTTRVYFGFATWLNFRVLVWPALLGFLLLGFWVLISDAALGIGVRTLTGFLFSVVPWDFVDSWFC